MRRPRRVLGIWARLLLSGLAVAVFVLGAVCLVAKAVRPYRAEGDQMRQLDQTRRKVAILDTQNAELRRHIALLYTSDGIVTEARKMGYRKPGEIPFVVETAASQGDGEAVAPPPALVPTSPKPPVRPQGLLRRLTGHFF